MLKPLKVVFCAYDSPGYLAGGPNTWLRRLLPDLRDAGFEVHALIIHTGEEMQCPLIVNLRAGGIVVHALSRAKARYVEEQVEWLLQKVREIEPRVFVANLVTPAFYAAKSLRQAGIPVVGVLHSDAPFCEAMVDRFVRGPKSDAFHSAVCVSAAIGANAASQNPNGVAIVRIPCGAPLAEPVVRDDARGLRVLYAGRITQDAKRALDVGRAFCAAASAVPNSTYTMVGSGPEEDALRAIIRSSPEVQFRGPISPEKMAAVFADHDVFVLLSDYEGLPISLMEAMAHGEVPVCLDVRSGISELVQDDINGLIVKDRGKDFVGAISRLDTNRALVSRLGDEAQRTIEREYSSTVNNERWVELLKQMAAEASPRPVRVPLLTRLPAPEPAFGSEDLRMPPIGRRLSDAWRSAWFHTRQQLRPRSRLRQWRQSISK